MAQLLNEQSARTLAQALQFEISCTEQMLQALQAENDALGSHEPEKLEAATQVKHEKILQMQQAGQRREAVLQALPAEINIQTLLSRPGTPASEPGRTLKTLWLKLMSLAEQCQQMNRVNGSIIERGYQQSRHALNILQGMIVPGGTDTNSSDGYNRSGHTVYSSRSRTIAQV